MDFSEIVRQLAVSLLPILIAITFHEVAHGLVAYRLGDGTAKALGRLTLNPLAHIDPVGTVLMPIALLIFTHGQFVFGYAKPVPINPYNFKDPKKGMALSAAAGPLTNLLLAIASLLIIKLILSPASAVLPQAVVLPIFLMLQSSIRMNVILAAFNLMPIPPLDGGRVIAGFLSYQMANKLNRIEPYGMIIVIILIMTGLARVFIVPLVNLFMAILSVF